MFFVSARHLRLCLVLASKPLEYMIAFNPVLFGLVVELMAGFVRRWAGAAGDGQSVL